MHTDTTPKLAFTIPEACYSIGIGRSKQLIGQGRVRTRKIGARTLITAESLRLLLESSE